MQFQVPQFIEVEDKIIGPFTFKQFIFLLGGGGGGYFLYRLIPAPFSYIFVIPVVGFGVALAFYKINNRPFIEIVQAWIKFKFSGKRYLWKKEATVEKKSADNIDELISLAGKGKAPTPKLTSGKLKDIAWSLDIQEKIK